jgi:very-short-patch-repair endonuclease
MAQWIRLLAPELPDPVKEYRFHPVRRWRLDLAWPDLKIGIECHGGVHSHGRHTRGTGFTKDREKMNECQLQGFIILEFTGEQIERDPEYCIDQIRRAHERHADMG